MDNYADTFSHQQEKERGKGETLMKPSFSSKEGCGQPIYKKIKGGRRDAIYYPANKGVAKAQMDQE
jgi:hypothetical protein